MESFSALTVDLERSPWSHERFELRGCLGEGASGVVYRARDKLRNRIVALKVLRNLGPDSVFYFKQEFRKLQGLAHPNLVHYRELFEDRGRWFLSMDLVEGVSLRDYVREPHGEGPPGDAQLERLRAGLLGLAAALRVLHGAGKVHCDVKPSNLRVDDDGRAVLLDFGLVTETGHVAEGPLGVSAGTAAYVAPEQVRGEAVGPEADWYAVGVLLYECLVGRPPFVGEPEQVMADKCAHPAPPPGSCVSPLPPALETLCLGLLEREPGARRDAIAGFERALRNRPSTMPPQPLPLPGHARFVGRDKELDVLSELALDHATPGLRMGWLFGESGLGKTALLEELWTRVGERQADVRLLRGRCFERQAVPYNALDGIVKGLVGLLTELPSARVTRLLPEPSEPLVRTFPAFARVAALRDVQQAEAVGAPDASWRQRGFRALRALLARIAADTPLVLAIDDVQWADSDSLRLMRALFEGKDPPACLLLCAGRTRPKASHAVARTLRRLEQGARRSLHLHLRPLSEGEAHVLALGSLELAPDGAELARQIAIESGGVPLFVDVLVNHVREATERGPISLSSALSEVYERLGPGARRLALVLALAAVPLEQRVVQAASRLSPSELAQAVSVLVESGWARVRRDDGQARLALSHERVRMSVLSDVDALERAELHWEIAQALLAREGDAEAIAMHFAEAGDAERAVRFALRGAEAALRACAFSHAERLYLLALARLPFEARAQRRAISLELARVHQLAGRGREAGDLYAELSREAEGVEALVLRYQAAEAWLDSGYHEEGLPWIRALLAELGAPVDGPAAGLRSVAAQLEALARRGAPAFRDDQDLSVRERLRGDALYKHACAMLTAAPGRSHRAQAHHLAHALRLGDPYRIARAYALEVWLKPHTLRTRGRLGMDGNLDAARRLSHSSDSPHARALVQLAEGVLRLGDDHYAEAATRFAAAAEQLSEHSPGARWERTYAFYYGALCAWHVGEFGRARDAIELALQDAAAQGDVLAETLWRCRLGHVPSLLLGRPEAALAALQTPSGPSRRLPHAELHALLSRVEVDLYRNDAWAFDQLEASWKEIERAGSLRVRSTRRRALWTRARAALCSARLDPSRRDTLLGVAREMAAALARDGTAAATARAALIESAALELQGKWAQARESYACASARAEAAGCWAMVATADGRRATLTGGETGHALRGRAQGYLQRAGARDPARMAALINGF